ncbi:hypothetical protein QTP86_031885 [Hemibagrus guttatus]|nr:hypothetical protein QTP86_031885 [Hemibagrus guttatus]
MECVIGVNVTANSGRMNRMSSEDKRVNPSEQGPSPPQSSAGATPSGSPAPTDRRVIGRPRRDSVNSAPTSRPTRKLNARCAVGWPCEEEEGGRREEEEGGGRDGGREGGRDGGREGWREGGRDGGMEGGREGGMEGWREGGMEGWREGGMEGWRDGGREGGRDGGREEEEGGGRKRREEEEGGRGGRKRKEGGRGGRKRKEGGRGGRGEEEEGGRGRRERREEEEGGGGEDDSSRSRGRAQADDEDSMDATDATLPPETEAMELDVDEDEEEDFPQTLSPLFQRSVSEDSAGSSASTAGKAKTRKKLCAFCYCGERSVLGQGELKLFGPTPGYVPLHIRNRRGSSEKDDDYHDEDDDNDFNDDHDNARSPVQHGRALKNFGGSVFGSALQTADCTRPQPRGSTDPCSEEPVHKLWDELGQLGLPHDINVQSLFDPTGQCCAHLRCAAWSDGVWRGEGGQAQLYVDKAIDSGSTEMCRIGHLKESVSLPLAVCQCVSVLFGCNICVLSLPHSLFLFLSFSVCDFSQYCAYCKRLGASIKCCEEGCSRSYHFPCAAAAGTIQNIRTYTLLCPDHIQLALVRYKNDVKCLQCDSLGDLHDHLFCTTCGQHYHGTCLDVVVTPLVRAGWQCPECKICLTCRNPGEDTKMLVCDMCDKGYHTFCLEPVMDSLPAGSWRCKNCVGVRYRSDYVSTTGLYVCPLPIRPRVRYRSVYVSVTDPSTCPLPIRPRVRYRSVHVSVTDPSTCPLPIRPRVRYRSVHVSVTDPTVGRVRSVVSVPRVSGRPAACVTVANSNNTLHPHVTFVGGAKTLTRLRRRSYATPVKGLGLRYVHAECVKQDNSELQDGYTCGVCKQVVQDSSEHAHIHTIQDAVLADPNAAQGEGCEVVVKELDEVLGVEAVVKMMMIMMVVVMVMVVVMMTMVVMIMLVMVVVMVMMMVVMMMVMMMLVVIMLVMVVVMVMVVMMMVMVVMMMVMLVIDDDDDDGYDGGDDDGYGGDNDVLVVIIVIMMVVVMGLCAQLHCHAGTGFDSLSSSEGAFMAVEEEVSVSLEPDSASHPVPEEPKQSPSAVEPAQEIQVTVTLTEGSSPLASPLASQCCAAVVDRDDEESHDAITPMENGKEQEIMPEPEQATVEPNMVDAPKVLLTSPTKESHPEPSPFTMEEPMDLGTSAPVEETVQDSSMSLVEDVEQDLEKEPELHKMPQPEEAKEEEEEVASEPALPEEVSFTLGTESSPPVEMDTTPGSELSFSGFSSPAMEDKVSSLKRSPAFSPDGSIKLCQSPFSTEASPRETPTHGHNTPGYSPGVSPAAFFPLTPKIGMGKPAISKRKFSPGRPRAKQVGWSSRWAVSSPSWSPEHSEASDGSKNQQQQQGELVWTVKLGRGSGFPGGRRPRGANLSGRGGRGRSRMKMDSSLLVTPGVQIPSSSSFSSNLFHT